MADEIVTSRPAAWVRAVPIALAAVLVFALVALPAVQGRFYGAGQIGIYVVLALLLVWLVHWTSRTIELGPAGVRLDSFLRERRIPIEGLRVFLYRGWWTRVVLRPSRGLGASYLAGGWRPDLLEELRRRLPAGAVTVEESPSFTGRGPAERG